MEFPRLSSDFERKYRKLRGLLTFYEDPSGLHTRNDLENEARKGLWIAYERYDAERGASFDTFAARVMQNAVWNLLRQTAQDTFHADMTSLQEYIGEDKKGDIAHSSPDELVRGWNPEFVYDRVLFLTRMVLMIYFPQDVVVFDTYWNQMVTLIEAAEIAGVSRNRVSKVIKRTMSIMENVYHLWMYLGFVPSFAYIESGGTKVVSPKKPNIPFTLLVGGRVMAISKEPISREEFEKFFNGLTSKDMLRDSWHTEFGVRVPKGKVPKKEALINKMYANYTRLLEEEGRDLLQKEEGVDAGIDDVLAEVSVGDTVWCDEDGEEVQYVVTDMDEEEDTATITDEEENDYEVPYSSLHPVLVEPSESEEPEEEEEPEDSEEDEDEGEGEEEEPEDTTEETSGLEEGMQAWCDEEGEEVHYTISAVNPEGDGPFGTVTLQDEEGTEYEVPAEEVHAIPEEESPEEDEEEPEEEPEEEEGEEQEEEKAGISEGDTVWCDEDGEEVQYVVAEIYEDDATAKIVTEDGSEEYDIPMDELHLITEGDKTEESEEGEGEEEEDESEEGEGGEEEPEEEEGDDSLIGATAWCDEDGEEVHYTIVSVDEETDTAEIQDEDGITYTVPAGELHIVAPSDEDSEEEEEEPEDDDEWDTEEEEDMAKAPAKKAAKKAAKKTAKKTARKAPEGDLPEDSGEIVEIFENALGKFSLDKIERKTSVVYKKEHDGRKKGVANLYIGRLPNRVAVDCGFNKDLVFKATNVKDFTSGVKKIIAEARKHFKGGGSAAPAKKSPAKKTAKKATAKKATAKKATAKKAKKTAKK